MPHPNTHYLRIRLDSVGATVPQYMCTRWLFHITQRSPVHSKVKHRSSRREKELALHYQHYYRVLSVHSIPTLSGCGRAASIRTAMSAAPKSNQGQLPFPLLSSRALCTFTSGKSELHYFCSAARWLLLHMSHDHITHSGGRAEHFH